MNILVQMEDLQSCNHILSFNTYVKFAHINVKI